MSVFGKDFLERVKSRGASVKAQESNAQSQNVSLRKRAGQPDSVEELVRKARAAGRAGPLVLGPSRSSLKGSWRDAAKWLEENFPEDFAEPNPQPSCGVRNLDKFSSSEPASEMPTVQPQLVANASESPQSAPAALPAPQSIPCLPSSFWWSFLFGNPDCLISSSNATRALYRVSDKLGIPIVEGEIIDTLRAGELRKRLRERFGPAPAEQAMAALWRSASVSPGAPQPSDQSQLPPGPLPWIGELNEPGVPERAWQIENGCWCG